MKRLKVILSLVCVFVCACLFFGCQKGTVKLDGDYLVIVAGEVEENLTLEEYMDRLQAEGKFSYEQSGGMVISIDGKANDSDYNPCWMLYTSDAENSNAQWGSVEYEGKVYYSASLGMESLIVKSGETYIWWYQTF